MEESTKGKEKCFVMMPISDQGDYPNGHFAKVYEQIIKPAVIEAGYIPYRVDENNICDAIINKIFNAIQECPMALCDLSNRNPNVLYELGLRQAYDKPVVLIQDEKTEKIFDVSGISTIFYKSTRLYEDVIEARDNIKNAILSTKNNNMNSLVRIIKASTPDISSVEISNDDRVKVMLDLIMNEIKQINKNNIFDNKNDTGLVFDSWSMILEDYLRVFENSKYDSEKKEKILAKLTELKIGIHNDNNLTKEEKIWLLKKIKKLENDINESMKM